MRPYWLLLIASLLSYTQGASSKSSIHDNDVTQGQVNLQWPSRLEETPWTGELYPAAIVEAWLRFLSANQTILLQPVYGHMLSKAFVDMLKRLCRRLGLARTGGLKGVVESNLQGIQMRLDTISKDFALQLRSTDELLQRLQAPLQTLLDRAHPSPSYWPFFKKKPTVAIPRDPKELLLMPVSISKDDWIQIMVRVADPMLLVLDTARMLGATDFALFRRIFQLKFGIFIERASTIVHRQNTFMGIPLSQKADQREGSRARLYFQNMISVPCSNGQRASINSVSSKRGVPRKQAIDRRTPLERESTTIMRNLSQSTESHGEEKPGKEDQRIPSSAKKYYHDERAISRLQHKQKRLLLNNKYQLFGALGSFCSREELTRFADDKVAPTTVMDAYLALLVDARENETATFSFKRIHSSLYTYLRGTGEENKEAARRRFAQAQLVANKEAIYLLPITLGPVWILCQIHLRPVDSSTLTLWMPVPVAEEIYREIGRLLVDSIGDYLCGNRNTILWEAIQLEFGQRQSNKETYHMSSGLVMAIARALIIGSDAHAVYCHQQGSLQAVIDLLSLTHVRAGLKK